MVDDSAIMSSTNVNLWHDNAAKRVWRRGWLGGFNTAGFVTSPAVFAWDMLGYGESKPCEHKHAQALRLQTYCSMRAVDFLLSLGIVDEHRIGITEASGGGTQTFVLSAIEGDFTKTLLKGELEDGVKDELYCPHCGIMFHKLVSCRCTDQADMVVIGLTPEMDFNNAITFCNVTGCPNGSSTKAGEVFLHMRLGDF